ncbi:hypothetical protein SAMN04487967_3734 [Natronorubrum sediminis]|uniref:Uncharacterized protein n=1 Tax=Natronorubrum sediminis TaxID=640943 RepID=A0A1H6G8L8_9EURY|nr:hypothetical protein SAMN04487967_3734 [Natronorubrum sediminis]
MSLLFIEKVSKYCPHIILSICHICLEGERKRRLLYKEKGIESLES